MMNYQFSQRISTLQPSAIREILKNTADPNVIPFAAGNPAPEAFPVKEIQNITHILMNNNPIACLQYSISEGYPALRNAIPNFVKNSEPDLIGDEDDILIVSGAQQGIELVTKCLIDEGDTILCEDPSFIGALNALRSYKPNLVGIPLEDDGINIELLEKAILENQKVKMLYVIPNFQNPTGITMSLTKRKAVYELCKRHGIIILEDNPYGDLRFEGESVPSIKTLDTEGIVVYVGSFSKIISPGLRVGYLILNKGLMGKVVVAKQCSDVHTAILNQMICEQFLISCNMKSHFTNLQRIYKQKSTLLLKSMEEAVGDKLSFVRPEGGLFVWYTLPDGVDMMAFCKAAAQAGVAVVPGSAFLVNLGAPCQSFRVNFSTPTNQQLTDGAEILGDVLKEFVR